MKEWFTIDKVDPNTYIISEYRHWEEPHSYLLIGRKKALLIDTGLGIENIYEEVLKLTDKKIIAIPTHVHWDHIGGLKYFPNFYVHEKELAWIEGAFPLSLETVKEMVKDRADLPSDFDLDKYEIFKGTPKRILKDNDEIDLGGRIVKVCHTPGHSPGHICFYEEKSGYLFTGDLVYKDILFAYYPSTDPQAYLDSLKRIESLNAKRVFPGHHSLEIEPNIITDMKNKLEEIEKEGKLCHGSGVFQFDGWGIWL
ncbi:MAG: MBL fold metallo-hydrolase [Bacillales bacterium]|nr:MBL fold metallo-hydrolase [Bacillales bacterium]